MEFETLALERQNSIAIVRFNRPNVLNALNHRVFRELILAFEEIEREAIPKVVILTGTGDRAFVAGTDITEMEKLTSFEAREFAILSNMAFDKIENLNRPVIAAINGFALGGGCEVAMACDIRIASDKAKIGQPEINLGIIPGSGGTQRLPRLVGSSKAKQLIFTGELIDAKTALDIGLVDVVVPHEHLMDEARKVALAIASKPRVALALAKSAINKGQGIDLQTALSHETECFAQCFATKDQKEGDESIFREKKTQLHWLLDILG